MANMLANSCTCRATLSGSCVCVHLLDINPVPAHLFLWNKWSWNKPERSSHGSLTFVRTFSAPNIASLECHFQNVINVGDEPWWILPTTNRMVTTFFRERRGHKNKKLKAHSVTRVPFWALWCFSLIYHISFQLEAALGGVLLAISMLCPFKANKGIRLCGMF